LVKTFTKTRNYAILTVVLIIAIIAVGANSTQVSADPCLAQLNYPIMPVVYSNSNVPIVVPLSATCSTFYGSQLYATGNANAGLGSVSTILQSVNGGTTFNGQLGFNLPPATQGHTVQISVSIYNSQYGNLITATSETFQVGTGSQQVSTTTVTQAYPYPYQNQAYPTQYPYQNAYQNQAPPTQHPTQQHPTRNQSQPQTPYQNNSTIFGYVAIAAILAAVIIATAGLLVYGKRQQTQPATWIPVLPPPR
jgi:hypothetical protein